MLLNSIQFTDINYFTTLLKVQILENQFNYVTHKHFQFLTQIKTLPSELRSCPSAIEIIQPEAGTEEAEGFDLKSNVQLPELPASLPANFEKDEEFLKKMHLILFDISLEEGVLVCPESAREFPVEKGIPNMLLHDDEV
jgi:uncharacterized protein YbaR (Trm112 family)